MNRLLLPLWLASGLCWAEQPVTQSWPQMRGPQNDGHAVATNLPLRWSETENVRWKTPVPGGGWSSPVVHGDQVWVTTATDAGRSRRAVCFARETGQVVRDVELFGIPKPADKHEFNSYASPSPVLEEGRLYATFGSDGTACVDTNTGAMLWRNTEMKCDHFRGAGSSPIRWGDYLLLNYDGIDVQYVAALDRQTGAVAWRTERSHITTVSKDGDLKKAYSTPLVVAVAGVPELVSIGAECVHGYEPASGAELWRCRFSGFSNAALPLFGYGLFYVNTGFGQAALLAVRAGGRGDVTESHIAWTYKRDVGKMSSPILVDDALYFVSDEGKATCLDARTGAARWQERLGSGLGFTASPVYAAGHLYFFDYKKGLGVVLKPSDPPALVASNQLAAGCMASPAVAGNALYVRTKTHLYRLQSS